MSELKQKYFKQIKGNIIMFAIISLFTSIFILLIPYANAKIINNAILGKYKEAGIICLVAGVLYILKEILSKLLFVSKQEIANKVESDLKNEIIQNKKITDEKLNEKIENITSSIRIYKSLDTHIFKTIEELAVIILMFYFDYRLGIVCLVGGIIKFILDKNDEKLTEKQKKEFKEQIKTKRKNNSKIVKSEINNTSIEDTIKEETDYNNLNIKLEKEYNVQCIIEQIIMTLVQIILLATSCYLLYKKNINLFTFILIFMYRKNGTYLFISINKFIKELKELKKQNE